MSPIANRKRRKRSNKAVSGPSVVEKMIWTAFLDENCTPYDWSRSIAQKIAREDWPGLYKSSEALAEATYASAREHFLANQMAALVLKLPLPSKILKLPDPEVAARLKFAASEERCRKTNRRLTRAALFRSRWYSVLRHAKREIRRVLGDKPDLTEIYSCCGWGPGSNIGVHGNATSLPRKFFAESWSVTPTCAIYFRHALLANDHFVLSLCEQQGDFVCFDKIEAARRIDQRLEYISSNSITFVPKTAKIHRPIAVEPLGNSYVQKGIDAVMRRRLKAVGIDLTDQEKNQRLARIGSISGRLATIDLSSASDTVAIQLVKLLLPYDWWSLLNQVRSPSLRDRGRETAYQKFSSMGNGFTFPLETLIFWAIARACSSKVVSVYGDDIIVDADAAPMVLNALRFAGFTPNDNKTFTSGPFRESCGADWYEGQDVRPVYLKDRLRPNDVASLMIFHNATLRSDWTKDAFTTTRKLIQQVVPVKRRFMRPLSDTRYRAALDPRYSWVELANLNGAFDVSLDEFMSCMYARWDRSTLRWTWKENLFTALPDKECEANHPIGMYWMFLLGGTGGRITLRRETRRRTVVR